MKKQVIKCSLQRTDVTKMLLQLTRFEQKWTNIFLWGFNTEKWNRSTRRKSRPWWMTTNVVCRESSLTTYKNQWLYFFLVRLIGEREVMPFRSLCLFINFKPGIKVQFVGAAFTRETPNWFSINNSILCCWVWNISAINNLTQLTCVKYQRCKVVVLCK